MSGSEEKSQEKSRNSMIVKWEAEANEMLGVSIKDQLPVYLDATKKLLSALGGYFETEEKYKRNEAECLEALEHVIKVIHNMINADPGLKYDLIYEDLYHSIRFKLLIHLSNYSQLDTQSEHKTITIVRIKELVDKLDAINTTSK